MTATPTPLSRDIARIYRSGLHRIDPAKLEVLPTISPALRRPDHIADYLRQRLERFGKQDEARAALALFRADEETRDLTSMLDVQLEAGGRLKPPVLAGAVRRQPNGLRARVFRYLEQELETYRDDPDRVQRTAVVLEAREPKHRGTLGTATARAAAQVDFCGVLGKRSVTDDQFRRALQHPRTEPLELRFLLLDPESPAFERRAADEGESAEAWRLDHEGMCARLRAYAASYHVVVSLKLYRLDPVWRLIVIDKFDVWVNTFLPGMRGTESTQFVANGGPTAELASGFRSYFDSVWLSAQEVRL